jgi:hypothetical protein
MRPELKLMIEKAVSKLKTARIDFENGQYDDSISRSYYAVFHALSAALLQKGLTYSSHSQVIGAFNREFIKQDLLPKEFTAIVQGLFADRQTGDYDLGDMIDEETAALGIENADRILQAIRLYLEKEV